jgi:ADP-ribose pyrophosphatase YjhB (NUDIX family)
MTNKIEICIRAVIKQQNKILVCYSKEQKHYFLPGGHIKFGEDIKTALLREMKEELNLRIKKLIFMGIVENFYLENNKKYHEINIIFNGKVDKINTQSKEKHISFELIDISQFAKKNILPVALKKSVLRWLKDKKTFWVSQF